MDIQIHKTAEFKQKYEDEINSRNSDQEITQLLKSLKEKEDEILDFKAKEMENRTKIANRYKEAHLKSSLKLEAQIAELTAENRVLGERLEEMKEGAISAIL